MTHIEAFMNAEAAAMDGYNNEIVSRCAPRWAWELIDETLAADAKSKAFDAALRADICAARAAMGLACELANDEPISRHDERLEN